MSTPRQSRAEEQRLARSLSLRALVPNSITAAALCAGLTGIRFAIAGDFDKSVQAVILAGVLDGIDGRAARMLKAQSKFGAELDSLADSISFGVAPALIVYLWALRELPSFGWIAALAFAICCVLRLARYNSRLDSLEQPHKQAGFLTGVPAPVGAGLAFLPLYLWIATGLPQFANPLAVGIWMLLVAFLLISNLPTLSWSRVRPPRQMRIGLLALIGILMASLLTEPWMTLVCITIAYLALLPYGVLRYYRLKRRGLAAARVPTSPATSDRLPGIEP